MKDNNGAKEKTKEGVKHIIRRRPNALQGEVHQKEDKQLIITSFQFYYHSCS